MKIKVNRPHLNLRPIREAIFWMLFFFLAIVGAFGWGVIYEYRRNGDLKTEVYRQAQKLRDVDGRLTAIEGKRK